MINLIVAIFVASLLSFLFPWPAVAGHKNIPGIVCRTEAGWTICRVVTNSDGLEILHATWNGVENFRDIMLPHIKIEYHPSEPGGSPWAGKFIVDQLGPLGNVLPCGTEVDKITLSEPGVVLASA